MLKKNKNINNLLLTIFVLIFLSDCYNSLFGGRFFNVSHIFKGFVYVISLVFLLREKSNRREKIIVFITFSVFCCSFFIELNEGGMIMRDRYLSVVLISKYFFVIFLFLLLEKIQFEKRQIERFLSVAFLTVSCSSILVFLFQIDQFRTYSGDRFGYKALIAAQNEASFFYMIGVCFFFQMYRITKRYLHIVYMGLIMLASIILGTKAAILGLLLFIGYLVIFSFKRGLFFFVLGFFCLCMFVATVSWYYGFFDYYIALTNSDGFVYMLTSKRNVYLLHRLPSILSNWEWYNILFGELKHETNLLEMDIVDLFLFFGAIGGIAYLFVLFNTVFKFLKKIRIGWLLIVQYFIIGGFAGHVFASGINAMYLALTCYYLQGNEEQNTIGIQVNS